jgi:hypothetical protein
MRGKSTRQPTTGKTTLVKFAFCITIQTNQLLDIKSLTGLDINVRWYLATPSVTGDKINANWGDNCMFQEWLFNTTGKDDAAISLAQEQLEESEEPKEPSTEDFGTKFQNRLKHLGIWFDAVHENTYHLFLKKLPDTDLILHIQSPSSIFVVWATKPPSNELLQQVSKLPYGYLQVIATTASTTFILPFPVKVSSSKWEKKILNDNIRQPVWVQYIFQKKER